MGALDVRRRGEVFSRVNGGSFDLAIVGGGINGAGIAHDASRRGLKVVVFEQRDLAFGTSSRSSKLIHGGLRYLEHYHFKLVFEGTNERATLRKLAPHLVRPLLFALPVYEGARHPLWMMDIGLWMYDSLALFKAEHHHATFRSPKRMLEREPLLNPDKLTGGIIYYDCITDDARLTLENAIAAAQHGAPILNHAKVTRIEGAHAKNGGVTVAFADELTGREGQVKVRGVINAAGVWSERVRRMAEGDGAFLRPTKGVHLVFPHERLAIQHAAALVAPQDGRVFFAIPWNGRTVIGTTDTDTKEDPSELGCTRSDVEYLLEAANNAFPSAKLTAGDVIASWAGLRPLIKAPAAESASDVPREHQIFRDGRMVTIAGGKLTTYRRMAAETVDAAVEVIGAGAHESDTADVRLPGAPEVEVDTLAETIEQRAKLPKDVARRIAHVYGARANGVLAVMGREKAMTERVSPDRDVTYAEVVHAIEEECAATVDDVLVRRTSIALSAADQGLGAVERVADVMAKHLGWDARTRQKRIDEYLHTVALSRRFKEPAKVS